MCVVWIMCVFFFFKQKTAYEMRISDWSSDVCSSDLLAYVVIGVLSGAGLSSWHRNAGASLSIAPAAAMAAGFASWWITAWWENVDRDARKWKIGRASCRERVCQYV